MRLARATEHTMEGAPVGRLAAAQGHGLSVEVIEIGDATGDPAREGGGEEGVTNVTCGSVLPALFIVLTCFNDIPLKGGH
jgi:hypothetical protein